MTVQEFGRIISFLCFYFRTTGASWQSPRREQDLVRPCEFGVFVQDHLVAGGAEERSCLWRVPLSPLWPGDGRSPL